jgi:hypothetical protein
MAGRKSAAALWSTEDSWPSSTSCLAQKAQIESEFGLTPSSRSRIHMAEPAETVDPFEEYLNRGKDP